MLLFYSITYIYIFIYKKKTQRDVYLKDNINDPYVYVKGKMGLKYTARGTYKQYVYNVEHNFSFRTDRTVINT